MKVWGHWFKDKPSASGQTAGLGELVIGGEALKAVAERRDQRVVWMARDIVELR